MSTTRTVPIPLSLAERHKLVTLGIKAGKPNRAIAKELGIDEGTVRRDRKFLATPENERAVRVQRVRKPNKAKKEKPVGELTPEEYRQQHWQHLLTVVKHWIIQEHLILPNLEIVLTEAGKRLYQHRDSLSRLPDPVRSPDEILSRTRPTHDVEDYMPSKLGFYADWLGRWPARCLPREEKLQDEVFRQISTWARS